MYGTWCAPGDYCLGTSFIYCVLNQLSSDHQFSTMGRLYTIWETYFQHIEILSLCQPRKQPCPSSVFSSATQYKFILIYFYISNPSFMGQIENRLTQETALVNVHYTRSGCKSLVYTADNIKTVELRRAFNDNKYVAKHRQKGIIS
jgi:hypothetical protein